MSFWRDFSRSAMIFFVTGLFFVVLMKGLNSEGVSILEVEVSKSSNLDMSFPLMLDFFGLVFCSCVSLISFCVVLFSGYYMGDCPSFNWYFFLIKCFVGFMILLVMVPHVVGLILGWDGLGMVSFLLVIFYQDGLSLGSGVLTFFTNRVGDSMLLGSLLLLSSHESLSSGVLNSKVVSVAVSVLVVLGCMTKSAQLPFVAWLPAAMAAPTPISALVHSSTLVTAGCFLIFRFGDMLALPILGILGVLSSLTSVYSGLCGLMEWDAKKVVALSTMGQMSVVMVSFSLGSFYVGFFHLVTHALFKSLLFICVGVIIHSSSGLQDLRTFSVKGLKSPILSGMTVVSVLSLSGLPFLSGFYSKDLVLEALLMGGFGAAVLTLVFISVLISALYSIRLLKCLLVKGLTASSAGVSMSMSSRVMLPCTLLSLGSVFGGYLLCLKAYRLSTSIVLGSEMWLSLALPFVVMAVMLSFVAGAVVKKMDLAESSKYGLGSLFWAWLESSWFAHVASISGPAKGASYLGAGVSNSAEAGYVEWWLGPEMMWSISSNQAKKLLSNSKSEVGVYFMKGLISVLTFAVFLGLSEMAG